MTSRPKSAVEKQAEGVDEAQSTSAMANARLSGDLDILIPLNTTDPNFPDQFTSEDIFSSSIGTYQHSGIHDHDLHQTFKLRISVLYRARKFTADHEIELPKS
ncbi:hypothetical protein EX30DRAFT_373327 [Ascodesmis nigricans]|uniref:Uncharacterized protein n=1 Tax=Ascodesmis nigricans TaxID=341454 RepID=A0A4S2MPT8_9PEZI|nr:hypothetical protein EX30DRAFT_373327 [Ascodesmis nigricans]